MFKLPFWDKKAKNQPSVKIVMGLGNPGVEHRQTYHNAGLLYIDAVAPGGFKQYKHFAFVRQGDMIFTKSLLFMNQSGQAVREALKYFGLEPQNLILAHDDSDLVLGKHKFSFGRGGAGHKGVASVINHLQTKDFYRLRLGIRKRQGKAGDFVLKNLSATDRKLLEKTFAAITLPDQSAR